MNLSYLDQKCVKKAAHPLVVVNLMYYYKVTAGFKRDSQSHVRGQRGERRRRRAIDNLFYAPLPLVVHKYERERARDGEEKMSKVAKYGP